MQCLLSCITQGKLTTKLQNYFQIYSHLCVYLSHKCFKYQCFIAVKKKMLQFHIHTQYYIHEYLYTEQYKRHWQATTRCMTPAKINIY